MLDVAVRPTFHGSRTFCALIVMPRSRSMSMRSRYWARIVRSSTTPVSCSMRSASVDLPWSMWAMMQKLRISAGVVNVLSANELTDQGFLFIRGCLHRPMPPFPGAG